MKAIDRLKRGVSATLWRLVCSFPGTIVALGAAFALFSALSAFFSLQVNSDQDRLVSSEVPFQKRYLETLKNFGDQEYLYVVISTDGTAEGMKRAEAFGNELAGRLRGQARFIRSIHYRIRPRDMGDKAFLYPSLQEAERIASATRSLAPFLNAWFREGTLAGFLDQTADMLSGRGGVSTPADPSLFGQALNPLDALLEDARLSLAGDASKNFHFDLADAGARYFFTSNGRFLIMRIFPAKDFSTMEVIGKPLRIVRQALEATQTNFPGVAAGLTGRPVLQADEMETTNRDMTRASVIAVAAVGLLFMVVLHGWLRPLMILASLLMAIAWTFGFVAVSVGELNLLSIVFTLVLVGIGVDFGVHVVLRYLEARRMGCEVDESVHAAITRTGPGVTLGALTSVCAFYSVVGSNFWGLSELGLIGGTGILFCLLAMLSVLPAMLLLGGKRRLFFSSFKPRITAMPFMERFSKRPKGLLAVIALLTLAAAPGLLKVHFSYNLLELQARGLESVEYEKKLIEDSNESTWYAIMGAKSLEETGDLAKRFKALPTVGKVESILDFVPRDQAKKAEIYAGAAKALDRLPPLASTPEGLDPDRLIESLGRLSSSLEGLEERLFAAGGGDELIQVERALKAARATTKELERSPESAERLSGLQNDLRRDARNAVAQLKKWLAPANEASPEDLPPAVRDIYIGKDGRYQIKILPNHNVWDFDELNRFVKDLRRVSPEVSGVPVVVFESARLMHRTFLFAAALTLALVSLLLWLYSRSVRYVLFTLLPLAVGVVWLLEIMGWLGLQFNLANFFAIPILIAIGVDGGVHFLARWKELHGQGRLFDTSTPTAVALSFVTTMIGFGGLLLAHHRGLFGLGAVMIIGSLTSMFACLLVLPAFLKLMGQFWTR